MTSCSDDTRIAVEMSSLGQTFLELRFSPERCAQHGRLIYDDVLGNSPHIRTGNFERFGGQDLRHMFDGYDRVVFGGGLAAALVDDGSPPLRPAGGRRRPLPMRRIACCPAPTRLDDKAISVASE